MRVIENIIGMKHLKQQLDEPVGFVPTMGYLHEGHISLVRQARAENSSVVVSIFVNPTQFGPTEDLKNYPRDIKRDLAMLESLTDAVFMPTDDEMYPGKFDTWVEVGGITRILEGAARPTYFRGVATVVTKLFNIIQPARAYFGQKDAQQVAVIKKMVADLNMDLEVVVMPTVRESDGLAMSSRNTYLNAEQRRAAPILYKSLKLAQELWSHGEKDASTLRRKMTTLIRKEPLAEINYISIADNQTLEELIVIEPPALVSMAVKIGKTRLIDNIVLK